MVGQIRLFGEDAPVRARAATTRRAPDLDGARWMRGSVSVWSDISRTRSELRLDHPALFPARLATRLIESYTTSDRRVVLDPFCGAGSALLAAELLGGVGVGLDISADYVRMARERPALVVDMFEPGHTGTGERRIYRADARSLGRYVRPGSVDILVTSPPYWDVLLRERTRDRRAARDYGDADEDLGRVAVYEEFLSELGRVFAEGLVALRPGGRRCVVVMDLRKGPRFYPLHMDLWVRMVALGFELIDIFIWDRRAEYNSLGPIGFPTVFYANKVHEYVMVFGRPENSCG